MTSVNESDFVAVVAIKQLFDYLLNMTNANKFYFAAVVFAERH